MNVAQNEPRKAFYGIVLGIWLFVAVYAIAHDQYLVRIAPDHFTVYHENPEGIESAPVLAAWTALKASVTPGLVLGMATWFTTRSGTWPKIKAKHIFMAVCAVISVTELSAATTGILAYWTKSPLYPVPWYPDLRPSLVVTQTIQLTCYFVAFLASAAMLLMLGLKRKQLKRDSPS